MKTFKEFMLEESLESIGHTIGVSDTIVPMNEGILKRTMPYVAAGLAGLGSATASDTTNTQSNAVSQSPQYRTHVKSASEIDREIKYKQYLDSLNKTKKETPKKQNPTIHQNIPQFFKQLIPAIAQKETGSFANPDKAIGDHGKAYGRYQVHIEAVKDVNRIYGTHYKHSDMFNREKAEDVLVKYLTFWGKYNKKHKGIEMSYKNLAAMWNGGGPRGYKNSNALQYAKDVVNSLNTYASN